MKHLILLATFLIVHGFVSPANAAGNCTNDTTCEANQICINRGAGDQCHDTCPLGLNPDQCEFGCCLHISVASVNWWVCGLQSDCSSSTDGDLDEESDAAENDETDKGCEDECTSLQQCITLEDEKVCAAICAVATDCASGCCAEISDGQKVCLPANMDCPQDQGDEDKDSGSKTEVSCNSVSALTLINILFMCLLFLLALKVKSTKKSRKE